MSQALFSGADDMVLSLSVISSQVANAGGWGAAISKQIQINDIGTVSGVSSVNIQS